MPMIAFACQCGKQLHAPDSCAGRQSRCPSCGRQLTVPAPANGEEPAPSPPVAAIAPQILAPLPPPPAVAAPLAVTAPDLSAEEPMTSPRNLAKLSVLLGAGSFLLPLLLGIPALIFGVLSYVTIRRSNGQLPGKGLALTGIVLSGASTGLTLLTLLVLGISALFTGSKPSSRDVAAAPSLPSAVPVPASSAAPPPAADAWKVIFRSSDPTLWNDDVKKGPDEFARSLDLAPDSLRYLRLTNVNANDYVIIEMSRDRLDKKSDDGKYGWAGANQRGFFSGVHHLGIFHKIWQPGEEGDVAVNDDPPARGWGFGGINFPGNMQKYSWNGKPISKTVFEIAVKSEALTDAEAKRLLKKGVVRE
jgi:hypothetical protein